MRNDTSCPNQNGGSSSVDADSSSVDADLSSLQADIQSLQSQMSTVQQGLSAVQADIQGIQSLGGQATPDPSKAITAGNKALSDTKKAFAWATQQGNVLDGQAHQIASQADAYANKANC